MAKLTLAPGAEVAGYTVFKIGAASAAIGAGYGAVLGFGPTLATWTTYSLSVATAGAILGSLAWFAKPTKVDRRLREIDLEPPAVEAPALPHKGRMPASRVSAFRVLPKG